MSHSSFDLIHQPWLRVRTRAGELTEMSLCEVFRRAADIVSLAGELPTQDVALLRLLLAILRRSYREARGTEAWGELWRLDSFECAPIESYLDSYRDRFDLLHRATPFYQVASLTTNKGEMTELSRLLADYPSREGRRLFTNRAGPALDTMSFAEAARWVVHCQAFDTGSIKTGAMGDPRVSNGKGYSQGAAGNGVAWCGLVGLVIVGGRNLFETLLLNLPVARLDSDPAIDRPVWERPPQTAAVEGRQAPAGPADLLTWQSRRIRLAHDGVRVTGALVAYGDPLRPENRFHEEFMTSWRRSEARMKAQGTSEDIFVPIRHARDRAVWRGLDGLLAEVEGAHAARTGRWLDWLSGLYESEQLPREAQIRMRVVGMQYGAQNAVTEDITDDTLALAAGALGEPAVRTLAVDGVHDADDAVRLLGGLAAELAEASGASGDSVDAARSLVRERGYSILDQPYRTWLRELRADSDRDVVRPAWNRTVWQIMQGIAHDLIRNAGPAAWTGRQVARGSKVLYLDAALAESRFYRRLRTRLRGAFDTDLREGAE